MLGEFEEKMRLAQERYGPILEQLRHHKIPEAYPEADHYPFLYGEQSLDEGSLLIRDEVIRLCGYQATIWIKTCIKELMVVYDK